MQKVTQELLIAVNNRRRNYYRGGGGGSCATQKSLELSGQTLFIYSKHVFKNLQ